MCVSLLPEGWLPEAGRGEIPLGTFNYAEGPWGQQARRKEAEGGEGTPLSSPWGPPAWSSRGWGRANTAVSINSVTQCQASTVSFVSVNALSICEVQTQLCPCAVEMG